MIKAEDDAHTTMLIRRLLDSSVMSSCQKVFDAFDESLMFSMDGEPSVKTTLKSQWKGVFHNISSVMDCISCQKCRLHGKIQLLGLGTALKVLLLPEQLIMASLERAEIVALFNTLSKFSTAIRGIQTLTNKFYEYQTLYKSDVLDDSIVTSRSAQGPSLQSKSSQQVEPPPSSDRQTSQTAALVDRAIGAVAAAAKAGKLSMQVEQKLLDALLRHDSTALLLAKHFIDGNSTNRFLVHAERNLHLMDSSSSSVTSFSTTDTDTSELDALKQGKDGATTADDTSQQRITSEELANHATEESCWVSINQKVYDFTQFLPEHPAGSEAILRIAGKDATSEYFAVHTAEMLTDFKPIGVLA
uniref:Cytochrome b5 heme-binding domain-containing protein n=1 Tax=Guillardia theta TaxID=55529 RepID=A0A7S4NRM3_GUITH|mmetsp:Transcript_29449/g.94464  ORF Transcript_29449/g.94464 Transcript_29449/m.94464 type:complete len:358 (+) Transcript_29449:920-1993(+)